jgi:hypothetical protein
MYGFLNVEPSTTPAGTGVPPVSGGSPGPEVSGATQGPPVSGATPGPEVSGATQAPKGPTKPTSQLCFVYSGKIVSNHLLLK